MSGIESLVALCSGIIIGVGVLALSELLGAWRARRRANRAYAAERAAWTRYRETHNLSDAPARWRRSLEWGRKVRGQ